MKNTCEIFPEIISRNYRSHILRLEWNKLKIKVKLKIPKLQTLKNTFLKYLIRYKILTWKNKYILYFDFQTKDLEKKKPWKAQGKQAGWNYEIRVEMKELENRRKEWTE